MLVIAICDDEKDIADYLRCAVQQILDKKGIEAEIVVYTSGREILFDIQEGKYYLIEQGRYSGYRCLNFCMKRSLRRK